MNMKSKMGLHGERMSTGRVGACSWRLEPQLYRKECTKSPLPTVKQMASKLNNSVWGRKMWDLHTKTD